MADLETKLDGNRTKHLPRLGFGCLCLFMTPFFAVGLYFLWAGIQNVLQGRAKEGWPVVGFSLVFLTFSAGFLALGLVGYRTARQRLELREANPEAPWLSRQDWQERRLKSKGASGAVLLWIMAVAFVGISLPVVLAIPGEWQSGNKPVLIALLFPVVGLGLGVAAARATIRHRKFGVSELELHTLPGVLGGTLSGAIEIPSKVRPEGGFKLRLVCVRRTTSGSGKNRSTHESVVWEEQKTILKDYLEPEPDQTGLPVFFNIPYDLPESRDGNPAIIWRLEVSADVPGVDYAATFEVPVFKTAESRADAGPRPDPTEAFQPPAEAWRPPENSRVRVNQTLRGDTELYFPAARNLGVIMGLLVFGLIWNVFLWVMIVKKAPVVFPIVWVFFDLILLLILLQMLVVSVRVIAGNGELAVRRRYLFIGATKKLPARDIQSVDLKIGMQSGTRAFYRLEAKTATGGKVGLGGGIRDKKHAEWLARQIREALGLKA